MPDKLDWMVSSWHICPRTSELLTCQLCNATCSHLLEDGAHLLPVRDVHSIEVDLLAGDFLHPAEGLRQFGPAAVGVAQVVHADDVVARIEHLQNRVGANVAGSSGDQDRGWGHPKWRKGKTHEIRPHECPVLIDVTKIVRQACEIAVCLAKNG